MVKRLVTIAACCLALAVSVTSGVTVFGQKQDEKLRQQDLTNRAACLATNANTATLKNLLVFFEARSLANPDNTEAQKTAITAFYNDALKQLPPPAAC